MKRLRILHLIAVLSSLTLFCDAQVLDDKTCLFPEEMDYFLMQDLRAKSLARDSAEMANIVKEKNHEIQLLKDNEADLKLQAKNSDIITDNYKKDILDLRVKYTKSQDKVKRRGGIIIGSLTLNLLFIGAAVLILK